MAPALSLMKLAKEFETPIQIREFLFIQNLLPPSKNCPKCGNPMTLNYSRKAVIGDFRCQKVRQHSDGKAVRISQADETWFMGSHLAVEKVLILTYTFAHKFSYEQAINECNISDSDTTISRETVSNWYSYCREICVIALDREYANQGKIGGDGHLVEIDEMKLGRRKYHRGRVVEGSWIFGLIDRDTKDFRLEICPANKRDEKTLLKLIQKHVEKGNNQFPIA